MRLFVSIAVVLLAVSGCSSLAPAPNPERLLAQDQSACDAYGFKRGTDAYAQCMQLRDQQRNAIDASDRARRSAALANLSASLLAPPPQRVTCSTHGSATGFGRTVYGNSTTTCY